MGGSAHGARHLLTKPACAAKPPHRTRRAHREPAPEHTRPPHGPPTLRCQKSQVLVVTPKPPPRRGDPSLRPASCEAAPSPRPAHHLAPYFHLTVPSSQVTVPGCTAPPREGSAPGLNKRPHPPRVHASASASGHRATSHNVARRPASTCSRRPALPAQAFPVHRRAPPSFGQTTRIVGEPFVRGRTQKEVSLEGQQLHCSCSRIHSVHNPAKRAVKVSTKVSKVH